MNKLSKMFIENEKSKIDNLKSNLISIEPSIKANIPTVEPPLYEEDCPMLNTCKYISNKCKAGANKLIDKRCDLGVFDAIKSQEPSQRIQIDGSKNIQINQQGNHSSSQQTQIATINDIPSELINEFKELIKTPANQDMPKWQKFLDKFNTYGGTVVLLSELFKLFTM